LSLAVLIAAEVAEEVALMPLSSASSFTTVTNKEDRLFLALTSWFRTTVIVAVVITSVARS